MSSEYDRQFQLLQVETCSRKSIVKITITQEGNFELTSLLFVGHANLTLANSTATIFQIPVSEFVQNL